MTAATTTERAWDGSPVAPPAEELPGRWVVDAAHSVVQFSVRHMTIARLSGRFDVLDGAVSFDAASPDGLRATVDVAVDVSSVSSGHVRRDELICSPEFMDAAAFPVMHFRAVASREAADPIFGVDGELTLKGVTRPVRLDVRCGGLVEHRGATRLGYAAHATIDRRDFGVGFDARLVGGGAVVSDRVDLALHVELVRS